MRSMDAKVRSSKGEVLAEELGTGTARATVFERDAVRAALIRDLIPIALEAAAELLEAQATALAGRRYGRDPGRGGYRRWGRERRTVYLGEQRIPLEVPRVRDVWNNFEVALPAYHALRAPHPAQDLAFRRVLRGLSCRDYASCVEPAVQTFGLSASSVSRKFRARSAAQLQALQERDLSEYDLIGLLLDGKSYGRDQIVVGLGVTAEGDKVVLGFVQAATENRRTCEEFLRHLLDRGLRYEGGLLVVIDGARGLRSAVQHVFGPYALVQRCQWHKRENVVSYLPKAEQPALRRQLQAAYEQPTYGAARAALEQVARSNPSAAGSLREGLEETLTVHRLGLGAALRWTFKTTNMIENLNFLLAWRTDKVDNWRNADQKHRWLAAALLDIEPRLHRIKGYRVLPQLRKALQSAIKGQLQAGATDNSCQAAKRDQEPHANFNGKRH